VPAVPTLIVVVVPVSVRFFFALADPVLVHKSEARTAVFVAVTVAETS